MNGQMPRAGDIWQHYNGNQYVVLHIANEHTERPEQYPPTVVYAGYENERVWARPLSDWHRSMSYVGRDPEWKQDAD
jgi:hypothetical protein